MKYALLILAFAGTMNAMEQGYNSNSFLVMTPTNTPKEPVGKATGVKAAFIAFLSCGCYNLSLPKNLADTER